MTTLKPVTLITGASSGIGAALAEKFAEHGLALALVARRRGRLEEVANAIVAAGGARPEIIVADLAEPQACDGIARELTTRGLEPANVVNCAGFGLLGDAAALGRAEQLRMIDVNARVLTDLSLRFVDSLERHRGGILNVGSVLGFMPGPGMAVYHATKAYVVSLSTALEYELKPKGIRVTALCCGPVDTEFTVRADGYLSRRTRRSVTRVARDGYEGFMRGRAVVVPGSDSRVLRLLPRILPRGLMLAVIGKAKREPHRP